MTPDIALLKRITSELLTESPSEALRDSAFALYEYFSRQVEVEDDRFVPEDPRLSRLPSGHAIDPDSAALCVRDYTRTSKFLRGLEGAIRRERARSPGSPVEVLYAGCGPFATLAVPLMTQFDPTDVRFTLLDFHSHSIASAKYLVESLGFQDFVRAYVQADATTYVHPPEHAPAVLVTETMQRALQNEPQVAITHHLVPQLRAGGILIPEEITVDACVYRPSTELPGVELASGTGPETANERVRIVVATLIRLDASSRPDFPPVTFRLPAPSEPRHALMLRTRVRVFESILLDEYEAEITCPYTAADVDELPFGSEVTIRYELSDTPGFRVITSA